MPYEYSSFMNTYIWAYCKTNFNYAYTIVIFYAKMVLILAMKLLAPYSTPFITAIYLLTTFTQSAWMFYKPYNCTILLNFSKRCTILIYQNLEHFDKTLQNFNKL